MSDKEIFLTGSYSDHPSEADIHVMALDSKDFQAIKIEGIRDGLNPSYMIWEKDLLYVIHELDDRVLLTCHTYNNKEGTLALHSSHTALGSGACHLYTQEDLPFLVISCYGSGHIHLFDKLNKRFTNFYIPTDATGSHAHGAISSHSGKWLITVDLGQDCLRVFRMNDLLQGRMQVFSKFKFPKGTGPRQAILSNDDRYIYVANELSGSVSVLKFLDNYGEITEEIYQTNASEQGSNAVGQAYLTEDNKRLLIANRGPDTISIFSVNQGSIERLSEVSSQGHWPRYITSNPSESIFFIANRRSGDMSLMYWASKDRKTLTLSQTLKIEGISCITPLVEG